jgi:aryl-alcohol dehydrogenase-like predicted oxidoreductase
VLPYRPLAKGLLTGRMNRGEAPVRQLAEDRFRYFLTEENFVVVDRIRQVATAHDCEPAVVALAWLLHQPSVLAVFPGVTGPEHVRSNSAAATCELRPDELARLSAPVG